VAATVPTAESRLRILHLTDPHLFASAEGALRDVVTWDSLSRVLRHQLHSGWQADLAVVTGDIVQDDSAAAYDRFRHGLITLGVPVLCVPGNHDVEVLMKAVCADPPFEYCSIGAHGNWLLAGLDSSLPGETGGEIGDGEFERLHNAIENSESEHVLVYLHHPPVVLGSDWLDPLGLANGPRALREFARTGRVRVVLFGHAHQAYDGTHNGMRVYGTPSTCRQFRPGSSSFAVDDRPPAYRRLELAADGTSSSELVWLDAQHQDA
jgi:3',5'-cyclic-AMP phosphodiesterase